MTAKHKTPPPWEHPEAAAWLAYADVRQEEGASRSELLRIRETGLALMHQREMVLVCNAVVDVRHPSVSNPYVVWPASILREVIPHRAIGGVFIDRISDFRWILKSTMVASCRTSWDHAALAVWDFCQIPVQAYAYLLTRTTDDDSIPSHKPTDFPWLFVDRHPACFLVRSWYESQRRRMRKATREEVDRLRYLMSE